MTEKALLRKEKLAERRQLSDAECAALSQRVCDTFLESDEYKKASTILLYKAYNNEVDTDMIFERAIKDGKTVAYPVSAIVDQEPEMTFYPVSDKGFFKAGFKGIPEPDTSMIDVAFEGQADICIAPGAVFDRKCNRIGYGRAFYDRYIRLNVPGLVIGLAFDLQIVDEFDTEECDIPVDMVITESQIIRRCQADKETYR